MKLNRKNKKAFTIVELVIVIGVIGILSAILIPTFANLTNKANDARIKEEVAGAYTAYVTDVADGYVGDPDAASPVKYTANDGKIAGQNEAVVKRDGKWYVYGTNGWTTEGAPTADPTLSFGSYNNCTVFKKNA